MKIKLLACLLVLLFGLPLMAAPPKGIPVQDGALTVDNSTYINANKILMFVTNHGNFGRDLGGRFGYDYGTFYPYSTIADIDNGSNVTSPYYAGGLWVGAVDSASGDTLVVVSEYSSEYVPGPTLGGTFQTDQPGFRVYKLYKDSLANNPNTDYLEWPYDQGAPVNYVYDIDTTVDPWDSTLVDSVPGIIGDQFCWAVYNDLNPAQHTNGNGGQTAPLGLEVRQATFAFSREDPLANVVFIKYQIYNHGDRTLNNCFFSIWSDPDLGGSGDDLVGTDTTLNLAFTYNATNSDSKYGSRPPSIGIDFFQGPLEEGEVGDSAKMWGQWWPGSRNKGLYSFNKYVNGTDPDDYIQAYQFMLGLDARSSGAPYINPTTGEVTRYVMSGDPVTGTGWLDEVPADRRHMQTTGPVTFRPGDSTEILCAMVVGLGGDRKSSISVMKYYDRFAQDAYEKDFILANPPASPVVTVSQDENLVTLMWTDTSEVDPGDYPFEGYTIYQGESSNGPWTRIANYDVINGDAMIQDEVLDPSTGALETRAVKFGTDSGIRRYFAVDQDYLTGTTLYNLTTYYFKVEAYSYLGTKTPKTLTSANRIPIVVIPQAPRAGVEVPQAPLSDLIVAHEGVSDGTVTVTVLDPLHVTGHDYSVTFGYTPPDTTLTVDTTQGEADSTTYDTLLDTCWFEQVSDAWVPVLCVDTTVWLPDPVITPHTVIDSTIFWNLNDVTLGTVVLSEQFNQSGDEDYLVADGLLVKVAGPAAGIRSFAMVANAAGVIDPPAPGAAAFASFPTPDGTDPVAGQQANGARWLITTGDNGGSNGGGTRGTYAAFVTRTFRAAEDGGARLARIGAYDWEWRFTEAGGWGWDGFNTGNADTVPFELWRTGSGTPDDPSDDVRLIPWILGDATGDGSGDNFVFDLSQYGGGATCHDGCEHSISSGDNDPYTDWVYWRIPTNEAAGDAGYQEFAAAMQDDPTNWAGNELPVMDRMVLCEWNGGIEPPFVSAMPETGTIFRITTFKPNTVTDVFTFTAVAPTTVASEEALNAIKAVPNPFYLYGPYDPAVGNYQIKFHHLPKECSITIYNLAGDFITRIDKNDETPIAAWNLQSDNRIPVASGIYIYVVDAPGYGQKIGKMAVFYEEEVLSIY
jgi:hypothetical protein